jgi:RNA polymerase sigma factor (sigma-70 family)
MTNEAINNLVTIAKGAGQEAQDAFVELWLTGKHYIGEILNSYKLPGNDLDDKEQIARIKLWECVNRFQPERGVGFFTFFYRGVEFRFRQILDEHRYQKRDSRRTKELTEFDDPPGEGDPAKLAADKDEVEQFSEKLKAYLSPDDYRLILDALGNELTYAEIAAERGCSKQNIKQRVDRLLAKTRTEMISKEGTHKAKGE